MRPRAGVLAAAAAALALGASACGGPDRLGREDAETLAGAQSRIGDALEQEETLRTDPAEARRLRARVRKVVESGSFETARPDEFGIAMLGELRRFAPSLVQVRPSGDVYALDKPATTAFLRYATSDAERALAIPVRRQVDLIDDTLDDADAKADTKVPPPNGSAAGEQSASDYVRSVESDLKPRYPREAARLEAVRADL